ncbi:MAG: SRPBCC domain-containing protein [Bacteroidetes bacterium]|nr:SRPBCC domain-containing protein [Bacteroidota bacterium]
MKEQIKIEQFIEAPVDKVWLAITDCNLISEWLMETNFKPEIGYKCYFKMPAMPGFDGNIQCEVIDVVENKLLVYTWQGGWMKQPTTVRFTLQPKDDGTLLLLEHFGFEGILGNLLKRMMSGGWGKKIRTIIPSLIKQKL